MTDWQDHLIVAPIVLPLIGKTPLASAVAFDAGVALLVVGATVLMLVAIAHQSLRKSRTVAPTTSEEDTV